MSNITERNTKRDIYSAYQTALKEVQDLQAANPDRRRSFQKTENEKILQLTTDTTPESIVKELGDFRLKANEVISSLEDQMVAKKQKLEQIQTAIGLAEGELKNVHGIVKEADSLAALVRAQEEEKDIFNDGMTDRREEWKTEQEDHKTEVVEQERLVEQARKRSAEEYAFNQKVLKRNDVDAWEQEKVQREEEVAAREAVMADKETHLAELETLVAGHEAALEAAIVSATEAATKKAETSHGFAKRALESKASTAEEISKMKIEGLEAKVTDLATANVSLQTKLSEATGQVQTIATEAIKGAQARIIPVTAEPAGKR